VRRLRRHATGNEPKNFRLAERGLRPLCIARFRPHTIFKLYISYHDHFYSRRSITDAGDVNHTFRLFGSLQFRR
jgi:hypothetical protein